MSRTGPGSMETTFSIYSEPLVKLCGCDKAALDPLSPHHLACGSPLCSQALMVPLPLAGSWVLPLSGGAGWRRSLGLARGRWVSSTFCGWVNQWRWWPSPNLWVGDNSDFTSSSRKKTFFKIAPRESGGFELFSPVASGRKWLQRSLKGEIT